MEASPQLLDRIAAGIDDGLPHSSSELARRFLGLGLIDESLAERILAPALAEDPRFARERHGWRLRPAAGERVSARLCDALVVVAPVDPAIAATRRLSETAPTVCVAEQGVPEISRAEARLRQKLPEVRYSLANVARRWCGYRGSGQLLSIAEWLGTPHVEGEGIEAQLGLCEAIWRHYCQQLASEGIVHTQQLDALLDERLERPDLSGRDFDWRQLDSLSAGPGIYLFRDRQQQVLYVGQSSRLAQRVSSYFRGAPRDEKDRVIRERAYSLETKPLATTADALIEEARAIRRHRPSLNTRLQVGELPAQDGVLIVPRTDERPGAIAYVVVSQQLVARVAIGVSRLRVRRAATRAATALFAPPPARRADATTAATLICTLCRTATNVWFLQPAVDGGPDQIQARIESIGTSLRNHAALRDAET
jgi:hypothetical protein